MELLDSPRLPLKLPQVLGEQEVAALLAATDPGTPWGQRDGALLEVLYATGLRVSELVGLTLKQLDLRRGVVRVRGKGDKERVVPLVSQAVEKLNLYLSQGRAQLLRGRESPYVFLNRRGGPLTRQGFWKILKQYAAPGRGPGFKPPYPAPLLRHPLCSPGEPTSGCCSCSWATRIWPPPRFTPTWMPPASGRFIKRPIPDHESACPLLPCAPWR